MAYILDVAVILVFLLAVWNGRRRGLIKSLSKLTAFLAAAVLAVCLCGTVAGWIFDHSMAPSITENVEEKVSAAGTSAASGLDNALAEMPGFVKNALANKGVASGTDILSQIGAGNGSAETLASETVIKVVRPVAVPLLRAICFVLLFLVGFLAAIILLKVTDLVFKLPGLKGLNKALGTAAGIISGLLWVLVLISVIQAVAASSAPGSFISQETVNSTYIVRWLTGLNPAGAALQSIMNAV